MRFTPLLCFRPLSMDPRLLTCLYSVRRNRKGKPIAALDAAEEPDQVPKILPLEVLEQQLAAHTLAQLRGADNPGIDGLIEALVVRPPSPRSASLHGTY